MYGAPSAVAYYLGNLVITSDADVSLQSVSLSGTGISSNTPQCSLIATPAQIQPGRSTTLTANCTPTSLTYTWTGGTCPSNTGVSCIATPAMTTTFGVTGSNSDGFSTAAATVTVKKLELMPILMLRLD